MIWLFILFPIVLVSGIAIYFEKGMTPPDLTEHAMKMDEADKNNNVNKNSGGS